MKRRQRPQLEEPQINLTPLIDIVFVVLIMFMVITPLLQSEKVELAGSSVTSEKNRLQESPEIAIYVLEDNSICIDQRKISMEELKSHLQIAKRQFPKACPHLFHDKKAQFGTYQNIKNAVEAAGFSEMDVILKPD